MLSASVMSATTDTIIVSVEIQGEKSISIDLASLDFGPLALNSLNNVSATPVIVSNIGNLASTWSIRISGADPDWAAAAAPGSDQYRLMALFNATGTTPVTGDFDTTNDLVTTTEVVSSGTKYAGDQSGLGVLAGAARSLWFRLDTPTSSSVSTPRAFTLELEAQ